MFCHHIYYFRIALLALSIVLLSFFCASSIVLLLSFCIFPVYPLRILYYSPVVPLRFSYAFSMHLLLHVCHFSCVLLAFLLSFDLNRGTAWLFYAQRSCYCLAEANGL